MALFNLCLLDLFWANCMLFFYLITVAQYYCWACIHVTLGFLDPFNCLRASLAYFFLLRHPWLISFPWASLAHSNSAFQWAFANSFGLPEPNYHILHFWGLWACHQPFTFLPHYLRLAVWPILSFLHLNADGFTTSLSLGSFRPICFP